MRLKIRFLKETGFLECDSFWDVINYRTVTE